MENFAKKLTPPLASYLSSKISDSDKDWRIPKRRSLEVMILGAYELPAFSIAILVLEESAILVLEESSKLAPPEAEIYELKSFSRVGSTC